MVAEKPRPADLILNAADELFGQSGYAGVSMRDITLKAGVPKATVFYYFGSKEKLFEQVLERYYAAHRAALARALDAELDTTARMHGVVDAYLDFIDENRRYSRLVQGLVASGGGPCPELVRKSLGELLGWTRLALASAVPDEGPLAARQFFVTFQGAVITYFTYAPYLAAGWGDDPLGPDAIAERRAHLHWLVDMALESSARAAQAKG